MKEIPIMEQGRKWLTRLERFTVKERKSTIKMF